MQPTPRLLTQQQVIPLNQHNPCIGMNDRRTRPRKLMPPIKHRNRDLLLTLTNAPQQDLEPRTVKRKRRPLPRTMPPLIQHHVVKMKAVHRHNNRPLTTR